MEDLSATDEEPSSFRSFGLGLVSPTAWAVLIWYAVDLKTFSLPGVLIIW